jgi:thiosulfate/3-mercaptopyruvate sulfurtransferase
MRSAYRTCSFHIMANPLISASELRARLDDANVVIIDSRWYIDDAAAGRAAYDEAHIPGARFVDLDADLSQEVGPGRHPLPGHEAFGETCGRLGIDRTTDVVVYDDRGGGIAARMWWMLTNQGHPAVSVLNGGLDAWNAIRGPLADEVPAVGHAMFTTRPWTGTVDRHDVENRPDSTILIDARAPERYRGEDEPIDPVAGHIPGAISMPLDDNMNPTMTFRTAAHLQERFLSAGVEGNRNVIMYCGSGVTACHNILAMAVAGIPVADLYVGSWSDWSTTGLPAALGDKPH